jgi:hypothetical protein
MELVYKFQVKLFNIGVKGYPFSRSDVVEKHFDLSTFKDEGDRFLRNVYKTLTQRQTPHPETLEYSATRM